MKFIGYIFAVILLGYIGHCFLPWWSIVIICGLVGLFTKYSGIRAFMIGFLGVTILWGVYTIIMNIQNEGILASRIGGLFGDMSTFSLILISTLLGGLLGGFGALTGNQGRKLFDSSIKNRH